MNYDHGPLQTWQLIWKNGHVEEVRAHQCLLPISNPFFGDHEHERNRVTFHGEIDGHWKLILDVDYSEIASIRLVTQPESIPGDAS